MWETQVRSLGWEDPLEKEMAIHSKTTAWKIPWTEDIAHGVAKSRTQLSVFSSLHFTITNILAHCLTLLFILLYYFYFASSGVRACGI